MLDAFQRFFKRRQSKHLLAIALRHGRVNLLITRRTSAAADIDEDHLVVNDEQKVEAGDYAAAIRILLARYEKLNLRKAPVQIVLGPKLVHQVSMERPQLEDNEIAASLHWSLKELVDIPANDVVADYYDPAIQVSGRDKIHVVAVQKSWLQKVLLPVNEAKLDIQGIINEDLALTQLFPEQQAPLVLLSQYGQEQAQLLLIARQKLIVSRQLKPLISLKQPADVAIDTYETDMLALELQRSLDYYSGQLRQPALQHVQLAMPGSHQSDVAKVLTESLSLKVDIFTYPGWASELAAGDFSDLAAMAGVMWLNNELFGRHDEVSS
ncbi:hypothetical protein CWE09_08315 [Aliidiomarina minuta]|uniref:MSHA biogenesis protein MshI n=1 Tax=Aliidiomarina minuta TaxID=880057 RepID=A0A432W961_9GAMM|nr:hypothetical protein [Aliidiomarina minuta]RUO26690.1 hypothetical protein CWE09_08315 [Aliidiomarina minuta]